MIWRISRRNSIIKWQGYRVSASRLAESNFRYTKQQAYNPYGGFGGNREWGYGDYRQRERPRCGIVGPRRTTITSGYDFRKAQPARWLGPALLSFQSDLRNSREAESSRRRRRYVNNATTHKGAAVVDGQDDRTSTTFVRDPHFAAERQRAVCGG